METAAAYRKAARQLGQMVTMGPEAQARAEEFAQRVLTAIEGDGRLSAAERDELTVDIVVAVLAG